MHLIEIPWNIIYFVVLIEKQISSLFSVDKHTVYDLFIIRGWGNFPVENITSLSGESGIIRFKKWLI